MNKFKLNSQGVSQLLKGEEMRGGLNQIGDAIAARCGDGYEVSPYVGQRRANVSISASSREAIKDNSENNTLLKNLRG